VLERQRSRDPVAGLTDPVQDDPGRVRLGAVEKEVDDRRDHVLPVVTEWHGGQTTVTGPSLPLFMMRLGRAPGAEHLKKESPPPRRAAAGGGHRRRSTSGAPGTSAPASWTDLSSRPRRTVHRRGRCRPAGMPPGHSRPAPKPRIRRRSPRPAPRSRPSLNQLPSRKTRCRMQPAHLTALRSAIRAAVPPSGASGEYVQCIRGVIACPRGRRQRSIRQRPGERS
jgi:hypothetical protein